MGSWGRGVVARAAESVRDVIEVVVEEVGVCVESHCGAGMPQHALDSFDLRARADRETGGRVAKVVGGDSWEVLIDLLSPAHRPDKPTLVGVGEP